MQTIQAKFRPSSAGSENRSAALDLFKSVLVVEMVLAHVIQLAMRAPTRFDLLVSSYINLVTFSGFLFAYGIGVGLGRSMRPQNATQAWRRIIELYFAYLISSAGYVFIIGGGVTLEEVVKLVLLARLAGYSEFLATFVVLAIFATFSRPELKLIGQQPVLAIAGVILSLISTVIIYDGDNWPILPTLISANKFANFPLIPYSVWFIAGVFLASREKRINVFVALVAVFLSILFFACVIYFQSLPPRFPVSAVWIIGAAPILLYYLACKGLSPFVLRWKWLILPGRYTLSVLVCSNIILFIISSRYRFDIDLISAAILSIVMVALVVAGRLLVSRTPVTLLSAST